MQVAKLVAIAGLQEEPVGGRARRWRGLDVRARVVTVALAAGLAGGAAGWAIVKARTPSNDELRAAARALTPPLVEVRDEQVTDRSASLANPPWDLPGSRVATITFAPPRDVRDNEVAATFAARARANGWRALARNENDERNRLFRFRRARRAAAVELERGEAGAIRVRPVADGGRGGVLGFLAGASLGLVAGAARRRA